MGSVKDLIVHQEPTPTELGKGEFVFSDRYSVFDWGEMPDQIPGKGAALCTMAAYNFEGLREKGIQTHYIGVLNDNSSIVIQTDELAQPTRRMLVHLANVVKPNFSNGRYDYSWFEKARGGGGNFVVPLEVLYRNGLPEGSSALRKLRDLQTAGKLEELAKALNKLGLTQMPFAGDLLPQTAFDFTTKFERTDRPIEDEEAYRISGLTEKEFRELESVRRQFVDLTGRTARHRGFVDYDGKGELIIVDGRIWVGDVFGTFDENRLVCNGVQVSKEFLRQYHINNQPEWYADVQRAKKEAKEREIEDWKSLCQLQPHPLPPELVTLVGEMYQAGANQYTGLDLFDGRPLEKVMGDLKPHMA